MSYKIKYKMAVQKLLSISSEIDLIQEATKNLPDNLQSKIKSFVDAQGIDLEFKVGTTFQRKQKKYLIIDHVM